MYVDKLPKSCSECEWFTSNHCSRDGRNFCLLARMPFYNTEEERQATRGQHKDGLSDFECPLQSITEYDKKLKQQKELLLADLNDAIKYIEIYFEKKNTGYYNTCMYHLNMIKKKLQEK